MKLGTQAGRKKANNFPLMLGCLDTIRDIVWDIE